MDSDRNTGSYDQKENVETVENLPQSYSLDGESPVGKDKAAEFLGHSNQSVTVTPQDNSRILRRIDLTILPVMLGVYFLQQLDKSTLSYASVFGLIKDAHLGGQDYSWLGSIGEIIFLIHISSMANQPSVYVAQLVMQPVIAYFLVKLPTGKFAAVMVLCWGVVLSCMAVANTFKGLLATRFFLGCFEASVGMSPLGPLTYFRG